MKIIRSPKQMFTVSKKARCCGRSVGFVPTMGALHAGHSSLIRRARRDNDLVVVSIFVNPTQFGPKEDFKQYPRNLKADAAVCRKEKVDIIFYPAAKNMYPPGHRTEVSVPALSRLLCGKTRPGHFQGVATVVTKLFNIVNPGIAYFGQKDAQQAIIIKRIVRDLNIPVKIKIMPTVRASDGVALSSRNAYLNRGERQDARVLYQSLRLAKGLIYAGLRDAGKVISRMRQIIQKKKTAGIDYIAMVDPVNLRPVRKISGHCLIALAVWIGRTRLIDNTIVKCPN